MVCRQWTIGIAGVLMLAGGGAQAHHSGAMFDPQRPATLTGMVREFQWTNPHCYIQLVVKNAEGRDEEWSLEMGAPLHLMERGWGKYTLKPGAMIKVTIAPLRDGGKGGQVESATMLDGKPLGKVL